MEEIKKQFLKETENILSDADIELIRIKYLGKKGIIARLKKGVDFKSMQDKERKEFGSSFNELKNFVEDKIEQIGPKLKRLKEEVNVDVTMPGIEQSRGCLHPVTLVQMELEDIFQGMGFMVLAGYEVETEFFNFDALNIPEDHPAREMQDTFWLTNKMLMRTHTSANQVRALKKFGAPIRAIFPGRCFRYEALDASHEHTFYQLEGLMVDREITIANLIAVMKSLLSGVFHKEVEIRLRPGYFPFVEPGFELDIYCLICGGKGCSTCKHTGWLELLPCGLIHPKVIESGGLDPKKFNGFAFGLGLTRLAMMKFSIPDIRLFNSGDLRFLKQFQV